MLSPTFTFTPSAHESVDDEYECVEDPSLSIQVYQGTFIVNRQSGDGAEWQTEQVAVCDTLTEAVFKVASLMTEEL